MVQLQYIIQVMQSQIQICAQKPLLPHHLIKNSPQVGKEYDGVVYKYSDVISVNTISSVDLVDIDITPVDGNGLLINR